MSKKTSSKPATKPATKSAKAKAPKAKPEPKVVATKSGQCPKGGDHEWTEEEGETFCSKCKEPKTAGKATKRSKKAAKAAGERKLSAIDAAAQVLASSKESMNAKQMIEAMAVKGLWTSPGGKTPHATLYSAILREINVKGKEARFKKTDRGQFVANA